MVDHTNNQVKMVSNDRVLILEKDPNKSSTLNGAGLIDNRLFKGTNRLHAIRDPQVGMWTLKYDAGLVPEPMRQHFTTWAKLYEFVTQYFIRRNIIVKEVQDVNG
jgi:hypothetical protein